MSDSAPEKYSRIIIEAVTPEIDSGRYPAKRVVGDRLLVEADIFMDGHEELGAELHIRKMHESNWQAIAMSHLGNDRWRAHFTPTEIGKYEYTIKAWPDLLGTWRRDALKKQEAKENIGVELQEGDALIEKLSSKSQNPQNLIVSSNSILDEKSYTPIKASLLRPGEVQYKHVLKLNVDRKLALFGAWYEIFPRSQGSDPTTSGTFKDCIARLPDIKAMGFDVVYLTPIHPIGVTHRKGKNNALKANRGDPGSPYAIGSEEGGHKAVHPELGTLKDFHLFVKKAKDLGMEVALDFALQVSRDHPYLKEHPEWFLHRPDGTIKFAENPPKKYEDIVNFNFENNPELWEELYSVVWFWIEQGVTLFRVDNPHTKPFAFWEWLIGSIQEKRPDIIFLSEAFTRPKPMYLLAKLGFTQSYTYFTWRHGKQEFIQYMQELANSPVVEFFRPNFFPTTPDILPPYIQNGGKPAFLIRLALAATLSSSYGMLAGYELLEGKGLEDKEEYADSEKYEFKPRDWNAPGNIKPFVTALNRIRNENSALHDFRNIIFHLSENEQVLFFGKWDIANKNVVFVAINLDCFAVQSAMIELPLNKLGIGENVPYELDDLLLGHRWSWKGSRQHLQLEPNKNPVAIFRVVMP